MQSSRGLLLLLLLLAVLAGRSLADPNRLLLQQLHQVGLVNILDQTVRPSGGWGLNPLQLES